MVSVNNTCKVSWRKHIKCNAIGTLCYHLKVKGWLLIFFFVCLFHLLWSSGEGTVFRQQLSNVTSRANGNTRPSILVKTPHFLSYIQKLSPGVPSLCHSSGGTATMSSTLKRNTENNSDRSLFVYQIGKVASFYCLTYCWMVLHPFFQ